MRCLIRPYVCIKIQKFNSAEMEKKISFNTETQHCTGLKKDMSSYQDRINHEVKWVRIFKFCILLTSCLPWSIFSKPRLLHLSSDTQVGFLQFLCRHINRIADSEIQTFVDKLRPHLLSDSPALAQLIVLQWSIKVIHTSPHIISNFTNIWKCKNQIQPERNKAIK